MKIHEVTDFLERLVPLSSQESYDNGGLIVGNRNEELTGTLICLDCTPEIVQEAIATNCNLIIAHHPIVFKGLKKLTGSNYVEETVISCIKNDVALYAIHTSLDNYQFGVNRRIGEKLGLKNLRVLQPKKDVLCKLVVYTPHYYADGLSAALFAAGAGKIGNYEECQFGVDGQGSFKPVGEAKPTEGKIGERSHVDEVKLEYLVSTHLLKGVLNEMKRVHPYEEVAHDIIPLLNENQFEGSGMYGELENPMDELEFLRFLKDTFNCGAIRYTNLLGRKIKSVAFCGGSGSFLLPAAKRVKADVYVSADFKYHEFFDAEKDIVIADIGHYESEQFTVNLLADILNENFTNFALHLTGINTNPINYF
jgi:dinuclear metal center YbgI/SA1388 family protein